MVNGHERYDEIKSFQNETYVSASEALWRRFQLEIIDNNFLIVRLDSHLESRRTVYYSKRREQKAANKSKPGTKLAK